MGGAPIRGWGAIIDCDGPPTPAPPLAPANGTRATPSSAAGGPSTVIDTKC